MSKRNIIVAIICIIVSAVSFLGGIFYQYEEYKPIVGQNFDTLKFTYDFHMPLDLETASIWLDWAVAYHQYHIDHKVDDKPEFHQGYIEMFSEIKTLFLWFEHDYIEPGGLNE